MKTAYLVAQGDYSDYRIVGVFSSKKNAESFIQSLGYGHIEEYSLDEFIPQVRAGLHPWRVWMERDGSGDASRMDTVYKDDDLKIVTRADKHTWLVGIVWAKDEAHAIKIANEKRAFLIASNQWPAEDPPLEA